MLVSYTIAAPIWKTTYRVVLDAQNKPFFQGWAIVDNVSDEDWKNVSLSLISGSPVSFIQPIQKPLYRYRPVVPMPDDLNLESAGVRGWRRRKQRWWRGQDDQRTRNGSQWSSSRRCYSYDYQYQ